MTPFASSVSKRWLGTIIVFGLLSYARASCSAASSEDFYSAAAGPSDAKYLADPGSHHGWFGSNPGADEDKHSYTASGVRLDELYECRTRDAAKHGVGNSLIAECLEALSWLRCSRPRSRLRVACDPPEFVFWRRQSLRPSNDCDEAFYVRAGLTTTLLRQESVSRTC